MICLIASISLFVSLCVCALLLEPLSQVDQAIDHKHMDKWMPLNVLSPGYAVDKIIYEERFFMNGPCCIDSYINTLLKVSRVCLGFVVAFVQSLVD